MMEKFLDQADDWERKHQNTWIGRNTPGYDFIGTGISAQLDLMSPTAAYDFAMNPNQFNAMKMAYNPLIAYAGYSWVQAVTGMQIGFANRVVHSAHMAGHTLKAVGLGTARAVRSYSPMAIFAAGAAALGYYGSMLYGDLSGTAGIGDMRIRYR